MGISLLNIVALAEPPFTLTASASEAPVSDGCLRPLPEISQGLPFQRVFVTFAPPGNTLVEWELAAQFDDPQPHAFRLQFAYAPLDDAGWQNVGTTAVDATFLLDGEERLGGKTLEAYYRVLLSTPRADYASAPVSALSGLSFRDWRVVRKIAMQEFKRASRFTGVAGHLIKERRYGPPCPLCLDPLTKEVTNPKCPRCYGVGIDGGYFAALTPIYVDLGLEESYENQDLEARGTAKDVVVKGRFINAPLLHDRDFWVEIKSGRRWLLQSIGSAAEVRAFRSVQEAGLHLLPFSDFLYHVPLGLPGTSSGPSFQLC